MRNRLALAMVAGRHFRMHRRLVWLGVKTRHGGRLLRFPVQYAVYRPDAGPGHRGHSPIELVVVPGHPEHKTWWRNLTGGETSMWVLDGAGWHPARALVLGPGGPGYWATLAAYQRRWPHFVPAQEQPVVVIDLVGPGIPATTRGFLSVRW